MDDEKRKQTVAAASRTMFELVESNFEYQRRWQQQRPKATLVSSLNQLPARTGRTKSRDMKLKQNSIDYKRKKRKDIISIHHEMDLQQNTIARRRRWIDTTATINVLLCLALMKLCDIPASAMVNAEHQDTLSRQKFLEEPQDTFALLGQSADLACSLENGLPNLPYWERDEFPIHMIDRYTMPNLERANHPDGSSPDQLDPQPVTNCSLHIERVQLIDDANFRCRVDGSRSPMRSRLAKLTVLKPPTQLSIKAHSVEEEDESGGSGEGLADVGGDNSDSLVASEMLGPIVKTLVESHGGKQADKVASDQQPIDSFANQANEASPLIQRRLMDGAIEPVPANWTKLSSQASMLMMMAQSGADSQLDLLMSNDESASAFDITRIIVKQNARLRLECSADQAKPHAELVWLDHRQQRVPTRHENDASSNNSLGFVEEEIRVAPKEDKLALSTLVWSFKVQRQHQNQVFTCLAKHPAFERPQAFPHLFGQEPRKRVRLDVHYKPDIISLTKEPSQAHENQSISFQCQAQGRPNDLTYRWFIDKQLVANATKPELRIERLTRQMHLREIKCQVSNSAGVSSIEHKLHVRYPPSFVTHQLPESLQPAHDGELQTSSFSASRHQHGRQQQQLTKPELAELNVARQLSRGYQNGQEVQLRCDFDSNPRIHHVQWYKITNENYSIMGNVTPAEADELITWGETHAHFLRRGLARQQGDHDDDGGGEIIAAGHSGGAADPRRHRNIRAYQGFTRIDLEETANEADGELVLDYDRMSEGLLEELAYYQDQLRHSNASSSQNFEKIPSQPPTQTSVAISEPLRWILRQTLAAPDNNNLSKFSPSSASGTNQPLGPNQRPASVESIPSLSLMPSIELNEEEAKSVLLHKREAQVTSSYINLNRTNDESMGKYVCLARAADGTTSYARSIYLVKKDQPRLISHPNQWAPLGSSHLQVDCLAQTRGVIDNMTSFSWYKDGKPILMRKEPTVEGDRGSNGERSFSVEIRRSPDLLYMRSILHVEGAEFHDFGRYNCFVVNSKGNDSMLINLQPSAPTGFVFAVMASLAIGSILLLVCILGLLMICAPRRKLDTKATLTSANNLDSRSDIGKSSPSMDSNGDQIKRKEQDFCDSDSVNKKHFAGFQGDQLSKMDKQAVGSNGSDEMTTHNDHKHITKSSYRSSLRQPIVSANGHQQQRSTKFAAIHESLEHKLHLGQSLFAHQHQRRASMESNPSEGAQLNHQSEPQQAKPNSEMVKQTEVTIKDHVGAGSSKGGSLIQKLWSRLLTGPTERLVGGNRGMKSRPVIGTPVCINGHQSATANHQSSMRRSSLSTSLSGLGGGGGQSDLAGTDSASADNAKNKSLNMKRASNNGLNLVSSSANLIQDSTTASDGSVNSGRSSSNSSGQTNTDLSNSAAGQRLNRMGNSHVAYASTTTAGCYNHMTPQANTNWQASNGTDNQSPGFINVQHGRTNTGAGLTDCSMYVNEMPYHGHTTMAENHVYSNSHLTSYPNQDPSYPMTHIGYTSQALGWSDHSQSALIGHYQHPLPPTTTNESYFSPCGAINQKQQPFYATICNNDSSKTATHYGVVTANNNYISVPHRPASTQCPRMVPTSDAGDAFFDQNYGTMLSRSKAYTKLGYATSSALSATHYIAAHSVSSSSSPSSSSHTNTVPNLNLDNLTQQLQAVTSGELALTSNYANEMHTTLVQSDGTTTTSTTSKNLDDNGLATHV